MNDSYTATRIHVMRTKLIKHADYERLLKMSEKEILEYLQATEYKEDIGALTLKDLDDLEVMDKIIAHNNDRVLAKLLRICNEHFKETLKFFLAENDLWNIKLIAESITTKANPLDTLAKYGRRGTFDPRPLGKAKTLEELSRLVDHRLPGADTHPKTLPEFIDMLNRTRADHLPEFIDERNIRQLLMHKRENMSPEQIFKRTLRGGTLSRQLFKQAASTETSKEAAKALRTTKYGKAFEKESFIDIESGLHKEILKRVRKAAGIYPLHPEVLVRYLVEKDIEIANLRLLIKGKHLGLSEEFIREELVI